MVATKSLENSLLNHNLFANQTEIICVNNYNLAFLDNEVSDSVGVGDIHSQHSLQL